MISENCWNFRISGLEGLDVILRQEVQLSVITGPTVEPRAPVTKIRWEKRSLNQRVSRR